MHLIYFHRRLHQAFHRTMTDVCDAVQFDGMDHSGACEHAAHDLFACAGSFGRIILLLPLHSRSIKTVLLIAAFMEMANWNAHYLCDLPCTLKQPRPEGVLRTRL